MGLYDTIKIEFNVSDWIPSCPVSDEELKSIEYQTKSMECLLDKYLIDVAGHMWDVGSEFLKNKPDVKISSTGYTYKLHNGSHLTMPYSGVVNMYSSTKDYRWIEFIALFHRATLESFHLLRLEERETNG